MRARNGYSFHIKNTKVTAKAISKGRGKYTRLKVEWLQSKGYTLSGAHDITETASEE